MAARKAAAREEMRVAGVPAQPGLQSNPDALAGFRRGQAPWRTGSCPRPAEAAAPRSYSAVLLPDRLRFRSCIRHHHGVMVARAGKGFGCASAGETLGPRR